MNIFALKSRIEEGLQDHVGIKNVKLNNSYLLIVNAFLKCIQDGFACTFSDMNNADCYLIFQAFGIDVDWIKVFIEMAIHL